MGIAKLTGLQVQKASRPGMYNDGGGLYLRVASGGSKGWIFRYMLSGRTHDMGLGSVDTVSLKHARERARQCRELCYDGIDPIEKRRAQRREAQIEAARVMTFRQCAEAYIAAHEASWRNPKHAAQWPSTMARYVYPVFGRLSVQAIDTGLVLKVIEPIWTAKTETASDRATRCALPAFIRSAGIVHTRSAKPISVQVAPIASPVRAAVRITNSRARAAIPF